MTRLRIVLDTNVLISGMGWPGIPAALLDAAVRGRCQLVMSPILLEELRRVLAYPKLAERFHDAGRLVSLLETISDVVEPGERLEVVADEADNRVVEAAVAGTARMIATGDTGLLALGKYRGIRIVSPAEALAAIQPETRTD